MLNFKDAYFTEMFINEHNKGLCKSLREIEREFGLANGTMSRWAKKHGIKTLNRSEIAKIYGKRRVAEGIGTGSNHWAYGLTKETSGTHRKHSERMKANNPVHNAFTKAKILESMAIGQREKLWQSEVPILNRLEKFGFDFVHQFIINNRICDFAIPSAKIIIECDGSGHSGRTDADLIKDRVLNKDGWIIFRIGDVRRNARIDNILPIIAKFIPNFTPICPFPTDISYKKRVLIRHFNSDSDIVCYNPNDSIIAWLIHRI